MIRSFSALLAGAFFQFGLLQAAAAPSHELWDVLLREYVSPQARVDYAGWIRSGKPRLEEYAGIIGQKWPENLSPAARKAALINAYNALTISWIIANYPLESIWRTKRPFTLRRAQTTGPGAGRFLSRGDGELLAAPHGQQLPAGDSPYLQGPARPPGARILSHAAACWRLVDFLARLRCVGLPCL